MSTFENRNNSAMQRSACIAKNIQKQKGVTLVIALAILTVMTSLGIAAMKSAVLQERMAGNARQKLIANNAAESALRSAEAFLFNNITNRATLTANFVTAPPAGFYSLQEVTPLGFRGNAINPVDANFNDVLDDDSWLADLGLSVEVDNLAGNWARNPRVVVELWGQDTLGGNQTRGAQSQVRTMDSGVSDISSNPFIFRITAIGWSRNEDIYSILQSTFITGADFN